METMPVKRKNNDYVIGIPTNDGYDKSRYKWDPVQKKVVYIKKGTTESSNQLSDRANHYIEKLKTRIEKGKNRTNKWGENAPSPNINIQNSLFKIKKQAEEDFTNGKLTQKEFDDITKEYKKQYQALKNSDTPEIKQALLTLI